MEFYTSKILHGGDYNPEQWLDRPDILERDIELLKEAGCNTVSLGMFSWSTLEPEEGIYHLEWMEKIIDRLYEQGISVILSTPSGARPKWMADKYPDILRVDELRRRQLFGFRHNHCYTSSMYRKKVYEINKSLSEQFGTHPGVILWHLSNEYGGECHCPLCQNAFREWLKMRYQTIENLNKRWCTTFWSHTYQDFEQIESPSSIGENQLHGLNLDWKRFVTEQTADFMRCEIQAIRDGGSELPVTTNLMYYFEGLDYFKIAKDIDIVSWDTYPTWHKEDILHTAYDNGMCHDLMRSLKGKPFIQMESCPAATNWQGVSKLKKPGMLFAQSMQAVAHGGDGAMYFQIRQSRGASEKFHGAVIDHYGGNDTRVFREVSKVGKVLDQISELCGSNVVSKAAIIYDWDCQWAMHDSQGPRNQGLHYHELLKKFYIGVRKQGLNVDLIDMSCELEKYELLVLPMCYMFKERVVEKVIRFVKNGGTLIATYWSGIVDDNDRCYLEGTPHGLMDVLGIRSTELDALYDWEQNIMEPVEGNILGMSRAYACRYFCDLPELRGAQPVMVYGKDFYKGYAALTVHEFGKGHAWYVAADGEEKFYEDLIKGVVKESKITKPIENKIPEGLELTVRENDNTRYYIYQNFGEKAAELPLPEGEWEMVYGNGKLLQVYEMVILKQEKNRI